MDSDGIFIIGTYMPLILVIKIFHYFVMDGVFYFDISHKNSSFLTNYQLRNFPISSYRTRSHTGVHVTIFSSYQIQLIFHGLY